jgi:DNA-directed RNA polymerase subunit beta'
MGHIDLAAPVAHIWFLKSLPSRIGLLLDMQLKLLERVLYFESYVVIEPGLTSSGKIPAADRRRAARSAGRIWRRRFLRRDRRRGGASIMLHGSRSEVQERDDLLEDLRTKPSRTLKPKKIIKRLKVVESFIDSGNKSRMDDPRSHPGDPTRAAPAGAARWRPFCNVGSERSVSPRDQPEQPI